MAVRRRRRGVVVGVVVAAVGAAGVALAAIPSGPDLPAGVDEQRLLDPPSFTAPDPGTVDPPAAPVAPAPTPGPVTSPTPAPDPALTPSPAFVWRAEALPADVRDEMTGVSWHPDCPVGLDDLRLVTLTHPTFDGEVATGELVVHADAVDDLEQVFAVVFDTGLPLERVSRIEAYDGSDDASMEANNTVAFTCRQITGGGAFSEHSYGTAIDLNPLQNPYRRGDVVLPEAGAHFLDRADARPGMLVEGDPVVAVFDELGWEWGGRWRTLDDWMHFERPR